MAGWVSLAAVLGTTMFLVGVAHAVSKQLDRF